MKIGTMKCLLSFVLILLMSTVSGVTEISFMKGVLRLNNSLYYDYYFICHTEGESLQWRVDNIYLGNYSGQNTIGSVSSISVFNCNFTATLLSLEQQSLSWSFESALILSCVSNFNMDIVCSNGSTSSTTSIPERSKVRAERSITSVRVEHVLAQNLVYGDNSTCTNIFVCGVNNSFMTVHLGNTATFAFTNIDPIGMERYEVQGSMKRIAILIANEPYSLVVAMFIIDSAAVNVTCGFHENITFLFSIPCPSTLAATKLETTGTMESEPSTVGESLTMASGGERNIALILGLSISFGAIIGVSLVAIIIIVLCCLCHKTRCCRIKCNIIKRSSSQNSVTLYRVSNPCDSIEDHPSCHGEISAKKADGILKKKGGDCYLARYSKSNGCFVLCVCYYKYGIHTIKHIKIIITKKVHLDTSDDIKEFEDFHELISYYENNPVTKRIGTIGKMCPSPEHEKRLLETKL